MPKSMRQIKSIGPHWNLINKQRDTLTTDGGPARNFAREIIYAASASVTNSVKFVTKSP